MKKSTGCLLSFFFKCKDNDRKSNDARKRGEKFVIF